jgi:tetratricopeptide (TPR) repeat protein
MVLLWGTAIFFILRTPKSPHYSLSGWSPENQREVANKLKSVGLLKEAINQYETYLKTANLNSESLAKIAYMLGTMNMDVGDYEKALVWFYKAEIASPETTLKDQISTKVVNCLERLGKFSAAQYALDSRSCSKRKGEEAEVSGKVVARIGKEEITLAEIDSALDSLPPWIKKSMKRQKKRRNF